MTLKSNKYVLTTLCSYFRTVCFERVHTFMRLKKKTKNTRLLQNF